jgi:hypothetical protein
MLSLKTVKEYLFGFFLMPWIWAWGYYALYSMFALAYLTSDSYDFIQAEVRSLQFMEVDLGQIWILLTFCIFINYTLAFSLPQKYKKINTLLFATTVFQLLIIAILCWPYLREMLSTT